MKRTRKVLVATTVMAAGATLAAPAAFAANTLSVDGTTSPAADISVTGTMAGSALFLTPYVTGRCSASSVSGHAKRGASVTNGSQIGAITNLTFSSCLLGSYPVVIEKDTNSGTPASWPIKVVGSPSKGQAIINVKIEGVRTKIHSTGSTPWACSLEAVGDLPATFNQSTQQISINTLGMYPLSLTAFIGNGSKTPSSLGTCGGFVYTGDAADVAANFNLTTPGVGGIHF